MNRRIDKEKARGAQLKQKVQLLGSLNTEDQVRKQDVLGCVLIQVLSANSTQKSFNVLLMAFNCR